MDWLTEQGLEELAYEEYQKNLRKDDLLIEDFSIEYPFETILPQIIKYYDIPNLDYVLQNRRIGNFDQNKGSYHININDALVMGIKLIGLNFKSQKYSSKYRQQIKDYFSPNITKKYRNPDYHKILGFQLSNFLKTKIKSFKDIPLIELLKEGPNLIYFDSAVQISLALLSFIALNEDKPDRMRAKEILRKSGLKAFILGKGKSSSKAILYFRKAPQVLHLFVIIYKSILDIYLAKYHKNTDVKKTENVYKTFKEVFKKSPNIDTDINIKKYEDKESYAIAFIAYDYNAPFEHLRRQYKTQLKRIAQKELDEDNNLFNYTLRFIKKENPNLSPWIDQLYK